MSAEEDYPLIIQGGGRATVTTSNYLKMCSEIDQLRERVKRAEQEAKAS